MIELDSDLAVEMPEEDWEIQEVLRELLKDSGLGPGLKVLVALESFRKAAETGKDPATAAREALALLTLL